jgi:hypothetical protein
MTIVDLIAEERRLYLSSAKSSRDWFRYVTAVERLRRMEREDRQLGDHQQDH